MATGYKQTEVGMIPEDWDVLSLGELTTTVASGRSKIKSAYGNYAVHGSTGVIGFSETGEYEGNAILVARVGANAGKISVVSGKYGVTDNTIIVRLRSNIYLPFFWRQLENKRINSLVFGSGQPLITGSQLKALAVSLPPLPEQQAIAEVLSDADALIESLEQLIAKKRHIKQGALQELLTGKKRLPGFGGEWEVKRLGELGSFLKGGGVTKDQTQSGPLPCIRYGEIYTRHNDCVRQFYSWISRSVASTATRLKRGDILFAGSGETKEEIGKCIAYVSDTEAYAGGDIVILRTERADPFFLGYYLNTTSINRQKASRGQGDAVVHISSSALSEICGVFPPLPEQTAIAAILTDMDAEIAALEAKLAKARQIKQGMMRELLTGRIRLVNPVKS